MFQKNEKMKILCVAEKNDAAKNIAHQLSNGSAQNHAGPSKYNRLYKFYSMFEVLQTYRY